MATDAAVSADLAAHDAAAEAAVAAETASMVIPATMEAVETSQQAAEMSAQATEQSTAALSETQQLRQEMQHGFGEIRAFFENVRDQQQSESGVRTVEVENHGDQAEQQRANEGSQGTSEVAGGVSGQPRRRHRFGAGH
jgi:hypothetical protein